jgi:hypothetical protein
MPVRIESTQTVLSQSHLQGTLLRPSPRPIGPWYLRRAFRPPTRYSPFLGRLRHLGPFFFSLKARIDPHAHCVMSPLSACDISVLASLSVYQLRDPLHDLSFINSLIPSDTLLFVHLHTFIRLCRVLASCFFPRLIHFELLRSYYCQPRTNTIHPFTLL